MVMTAQLRHVGVVDLLPRTVNHSNASGDHQGLVG
jgi:hypothetical protein